MKKTNKSSNDSYSSFLINEADNREARIIKRKMRFLPYVFLIVAVGFFLVMLHKLSALIASA
ncbi:hypothetical protein LW059_004511 [Salmonella enterica]|nr:hypothetical protein [Salmonella enterica]EIL7441936.1 hypothetical protein [Salmonella enterica]EIL8919940.1 hypothetical protein [Salmonella enterica]EIL8929180.1 hypothetical protein [Salmonella enterica]EIL8962518.1 hypothetical protein [Salmonella enterica]